MPLRLGWAHGALLTTYPGDTTMASLDQVTALAAGGLVAHPALSASVAGESRLANGRSASRPVVGCPSGRSALRRRDMVRPGTYEEIMRRSTTFVDDFSMSLQIPLSDWSGYFLFAAIDGDGPCQAVNLGVSIGLVDGTEHGVPQWDGDPYRLFVITSSICDGTSYRLLDDTTYTRSDVIYSRAGLDLQVADVVRVRGAWPYFELYFRDTVHDITYELDGRAGYAHWIPDHIQRGTMYNYVCFPDFAFRGTITIRGAGHHVEGVGGLDHVVARNVGSRSSPGVGFWHYDPIHWGKGLVSNGLYYLGAAGEPYIRQGVMTVPDGGYHPASLFTIEYLELGEGSANAGAAGEPQVVPRRWRGTMEAAHGVLTYTTEPMHVRDPAGADVIEPNVVFRAEGEFRGKRRLGPQAGWQGPQRVHGRGMEPSPLGQVSQAVDSQGALSHPEPW